MWKRKTLKCGGWFHCAGAAFCEIRSFLRSHIGIGVWRVVFLGCWMWLWHWDLRFRLLLWSGVFVTSLSSNGDFGGWACAQNVVEIIPNVWCGANFLEANMIWYCHFWWQAQYFARALRCGSAIFVAGAGNREVAGCGGDRISWQAQYSVRVAKLCGRPRESWGYELWSRWMSPWHCDGRVTLESRNCSAGLLDLYALTALPLDFWRKSRTKCSFWRLCHVTFGGSLVRNARFGGLTRDGGSFVRNARFADSKCEFLTKSRTKRSLWRIDAWLLEEVSYEALVLQTRSVSFWGCLVVRNPRFGGLTREFWRKSCEPLALQTWSVSFWGGLVRNASSHNSPTRVSHNSVLHSPTGVPYKSVPQEYPTRVPHKSVPQGSIRVCPTTVPARVSDESVLQECPTRVSHKSLSQECRTRVSNRSVLQERPTRVSCKSVLQECPTRVTHKSLPQECPTRVSHKSVPPQLFYKSVGQECPARVSHKSVRQECPTMPHKSVPQECLTRVSYLKGVRHESPRIVSHKSVRQECRTRVSHQSFPQSVLQESVP